jgi:hypothetical protein
MENHGKQNVLIVKHGGWVPQEFIEAIMVQAQSLENHVG